MFGSVILDVAIGLVLIYFLFSLIASGVTEWVMKFKEKRADYLRDGILGLLQDNEYLTEEFYKHPLVFGLYWESKEDLEKNKKNTSILTTLLPFLKRDNNNPTPSYIPADIFARVLIDILAPTGGKMSMSDLKNDLLPFIDKDPMYQLYEQVMDIVGNNLSGEDALDKIKAEVSTLTNQNPVLVGAILSAIAKNTQNGQITNVGNLGADITTTIDQVSSLYKAAATLVHNTEDSLVTAQKNIETWFNDAMDRVSGWYKEHTYQWIFGVSLILVIATNVDTVNLAKTLYYDKNMRDGLVAAAAQTVQMNAASPDAYTITEGSKSVIIKDIENELGALKLPLGTAYYKIELKQVKESGGNYIGWFFLKIIGLLISAFAIAQGAPFWFEMLARLINVRQTGKIPQSAASGGMDSGGDKLRIIVDNKPNEMPGMPGMPNNSAIMPPRRDD